MMQTATIVRSHAGITRSLLVFLPRRTAGAAGREEAGFRRVVVVRGFLSAINDNNNDKGKGCDKSDDSTYRGE